MVQRVLKFEGLGAGADVAPPIAYCVSVCANKYVLYIIDNQYIMKNIEKF